MDKNIKECYDLSYKLFKTEDVYNKHKTDIDFIKMLRKHFDENIFNDQLVYKGKLCYLRDIKISLKSQIQVNSNYKKSNNYTIFMSTMTIIITLIGSSIMADERIPIVNKVGMVLVASLMIFGLGMSVSIIEGWYMNTLFNYELFYEQVISILNEVEKQKKIDITIDSIESKEIEMVSSKK